MNRSQEYIGAKELGREIGLETHVALGLIRKLNRHLNEEGVEAKHPYMLHRKLLERLKQDGFTTKMVDLAEVARSTSADKHEGGEV